MPTYHLHLVNVPEENTLTTVRWKCTSCGQFCDFSRPGFGEPSATETQYPEDGDIYFGNGGCVPVLLNVPNLTFWGYFTDAELVAIDANNTDAVKAGRFRLAQMNNGIPVNHPLVRGILLEFEGHNLLAAGRADEIITLCTQP